MLDFGYYNMDCMEGMKSFPDNYFDLAIVDPPYYSNAYSIITPGGNLSTTGVERKKYKMPHGASVLTAWKTRRLLLIQNAGGIRVERQKLIEELERIASGLGESGHLADANVIVDAIVEIKSLSARVYRLKDAAEKPEKGNRVICVRSGAVGTVVKKYCPTACAEQTMVRTDDGRLYHAPSVEWRVMYERKANFI